MGLKESGLRGSLRNVSVGIDAIPDSVVDNFEPDPEGPYSEDPPSIDEFYEGPTSDINITDSDVLEGGFSLHSSSGSSNSNIVTDEFDNIPERGDRFSYYAIALSSSDSVPGLAFGVDPEHNGGDSGDYDCYAVQFRHGSNSIDIMKNGTTNDDIQESESVSLDVGEWYEMEIDWTSTSIDLTIYEIDQDTVDAGVIPDRQTDLASVSFSDQEYDSGQIAWVRSFSSGDIAWDALHNFDT